MKIVVNIDVPELSPGIAFYCAALGLTHSRTLDDDVAELTGAGRESECIRITDSFCIYYGRWRCFFRLFVR